MTEGSVMLCRFVVNLKFVINTKLGYPSKSWKVTLHTHLEGHGQAGRIVQQYPYEV